MKRLPKDTKTDYFRRRKNGGVDGRSSQDHEPLTAEQRELAAKAMEIVGPYLSKVQAKHPKSANLIASELHVRVVHKVAGFDPSRSSLRTWVHLQLQGAVLDARRTDYRDEGGSLRNRKRVKRTSLDQDRMADDASGDTLTLKQMVEADNQDDSGSADAEELAEHILKPLSAEVREFFRLYAQGYTLKEIGGPAGYSESRMSQIFTAARPLIQLRYEALIA